MAEKQYRDKSEQKNVIGQRMRQARQRFRPRVTLLDLSARIDEYGVHINRIVLGRIELGRRIVLDYELRAIAAALYVPVSWLISEEELWEDSAGIPGRPDLPGNT